MVTQALVDACQELLIHLDKTEIAPRGMMLVEGEDGAEPKVWIVPSTAMEKQGNNAKPNFYRIVSNVLHASSEKTSAIDISQVEMKLSDHPAIRGLSVFMRAEGINTIHFQSNNFNGFWLPDGVMYRLAL